MDDSANRKAYGHELTAEDILYNGKAHNNEVVSPFVRELDKDAPPAAKRASVVDVGSGTAVPVVTLPLPAPLLFAPKLARQAS